MKCLKKAFGERFRERDRQAGSRQAAQPVKAGVFCDMRGTLSLEIFDVLKGCSENGVPVTLFSSGTFAPYFPLPDFLSGKVLRKDACKGMPLAIVIDDTNPARQGLHALRWLRPGDKDELNRLCADPQAYLREVLGGKAPSPGHGQPTEMRPDP